MPKVKGSRINAQFSYIKDNYGPEKLAAVMDVLSPLDRSTLTRVSDPAWYPAKLYERLVLAICDVVAPKDDSALENIGRCTADEMLTKTYKALRGRDPHEMLGNFVPIHQLMNQPAEMKAAMVSAGRLEIKVIQPKSTPALCSVAAGFYKRSMEMAGGYGVTLDHTKCFGRGDEFCLYELSWSAATRARGR
ncbi:MAG TPA: hypothetical protein VJX67_07635 [Blastocatellia bacterium]|nr:hypothetical protein [Blastocatellia bacterium]